MAKTENKTKPTAVDPADFVASVAHPQRREDGLTLLEFFQRVTGLKPRMWGPGIVGYGRYHYKYDSRGEGDWFLTGFSPRKQNLSLYIMSGFGQYDSLLSNLGKYKTGKSCLYVKKLGDINRDILKEMITSSVQMIAKKYPEG